MIDPQLEGRVALVTGANQGIGAAIARALAEQGAAVFITSLRLGPDDPGVQAMQATDGATASAYANARVQPADAVESEILSRGGRTGAWEADLSDPAAVAELFDPRRRRHLGPLRSW